MTLVSQAELVTLTLSKPYSFLPCWPKTWLRRRRQLRLGRRRGRHAHRYLEARTKRDIVSGKRGAVGDEQRAASAATAGGAGGEREEDAGDDEGDEHDQQPSSSSSSSHSPSRALPSQSVWRPCRPRPALDHHLAVVSCVMRVCFAASARALKGPRSTSNRTRLFDFYRPNSSRPVARKANSSKYHSPPRSDSADLPCCTN